MKKSLMDDYIFKRFLKSPDSRWYVVLLLASILKLDPKYVDKHLVLKESNLFNYKNEKGRELDFICELDFRAINLEGNNRKYDNLFEDKIRYLNQLYNLYFSRNKRSADKEIIQIHFNNFKEKKTKNVIVYKNNENEVMSQNIKVITYSLENIKEKWYNKFTLSKEEKLLLVFKLSENREELEKFVRSDKFMKKLDEENNLINYIYEKMDKAFDYEEELKGQYYAIGRYEGRAEGKQEGKVEEKIAIAKNLLKMNFNRDQVIQATGLPKKEIEKLVCN